MPKPPRKYRSRGIQRKVGDMLNPPRRIIRDTDGNIIGTREIPKNRNNIVAVNIATINAIGL